MAVAFLLTRGAQCLDRLLPEAAEVALEEADRVGVGETNQSLGLVAVVGQVDRQVVEADTALDAQSRFRVVLILGEPVPWPPSRSRARGCRPRHRARCRAWREPARGAIWGKRDRTAQARARGVEHGLEQGSLITSARWLVLALPAGPRNQRIDDLGPYSWRWPGGLPPTGSHSGVRLRKTRGHPARYRSRGSNGRRARRPSRFGPGRSGAGLRATVGSGRG